MKVAGLHGEAAAAPDVEVVIAFVEQFGVPVFPCRPNDKRPATANGFKDATREAAQIRRWAAEVRNANWAMPTGAVSGIIAVDVDIRPDAGKHGDETLAKLRAQHGALPETAMVLTPSGRHYVAATAARGDCERRRGGEARSGLDVKAEGGYVVIPPSQINGRPYAFEASSDPGDGIAEAPRVAARAAGKRPSRRKRKRRSTARAVDWIDNVAEETRCTTHCATSRRTTQRAGCRSTRFAVCWNRLSTDPRRRATIDGASVSARSRGS